MTTGELQALWIADHPRPLWDDPNYWLTARPQFDTIPAQSDKEDTNAGS